MARASDTRCFWPPDRLMLREPHGNKRHSKEKMSKQEQRRCRLSHRGAQITQETRTRARRFRWRRRPGGSPARPRSTQAWNVGGHHPQDPQERSTTGSAMSIKGRDTTQHTRSCVRQHAARVSWYLQTRTQYNAKRDRRQRERSQAHAGKITFARRKAGQTGCCCGPTR